MKEAEERIQAATPENWSVSVPQAAVVEDSAGDHMAWLVVFECALEVDGPATYGMSLRTLEVSAMGRTVEDILRVAESLPTIEAALCPGFRSWNSRVYLWASLDRRRGRGQALAAASAGVSSKKRGGSATASALKIAA